MLKKLYCLALLLAGTGAIFSQNSLWKDLDDRSFSPIGKRYIVPEHYRTVALDVAQLKPILSDAPERFTPAAADNYVVLQVPMPDGSMADFRLFESSVMEKPLQDKYPDIRCYTGAGITDPTATMKCDFTPQGFHAMILAAGKSPVFINPYTQGETERYIVYFKKDLKPRAGQEFICETDDAMLPIGGAGQYVTGADFQGDCQHRKYRLALACTGEYANFHGSTGANKAPALAAMTTTMNRVNGVYERDLAVTMMLIANTDLLIYTNSGSDPYSNSNGGTMLGQNVTTCNNVIGSANYDIGHVFSTGGGGIAGLGVVCGMSKARGVTGLGQPIGDGFDIDYVAHEMGHQFGGNHTFNSNQGSCNGNQNNSTAMEPGSGTTIMAYAGICGSHDVQPHSDDHFHAINLQEISNYINSGVGNSCPVKTVTGNKPPGCNAGPDRVIPKGTPFALTATGSDPDNDPVTYCWEQMDAQTATMPPVGTNTGGPLFRSFSPTASPTRFFPRLTDLISNTNYLWEELPTVARNMNFRVTIRDNHAGAGCTEEDDVVVTVNGGSGPFVVTAPNTAVTWFVSEPKTVTWNVASTNLSPVNCSQVRISLSTDGGLTYPVILANNEPNDGSANVTVPNNISTTCRVKVEAIGNIFFDISNVNFTIALPPTPTFVISTSNSNLSACPGDEPAFNIKLTSLLGFNDPVQITITGLPQGADAIVFFNPALPLTNPNVPVSITNLALAAPGDYVLTITAVSGTITQTTTVNLKVNPGKPSAAATAVMPANGTSGVGLNTDVMWSGIPFSENYYFEIASNPSFDPASIVGTNFLGLKTTTQVTGLQPSTVYYWRVKPSNICGEGGFSGPFAFQTGKETCNQTFASTNVPVVISNAEVDTVTSTLNVPANKFVTDVNVSATIGHTWIGDLGATLTSPSGKTVKLFDRPGEPAAAYGCENDDINASFDDEAIKTSTDFENACGTGIPSISGNYKPLESLNAFNGENLQGAWTLTVYDAYEEDGGQLNSWSLNFCFTDPITQGNLLKNNVLIVPFSQTRTVNSTLLQTQASASPGMVTYILLSATAHGTLVVNGTPIGLGGTFTQANIDANQVAYTHNGDTASTDQFIFDVVDGNNAAWLHAGVFQINIVKNNLAVSAAQTANILCAGQSNGEITVTVFGGTQPLNYRLNGGAPQSSNVFSNLGPGTYTVLVTDDNGFSATTNSVEITAPTVLQASATVDSDDVTAAGSGGTPPYSFSINSPDGSFENLPNGIYTITLTDVNGCTSTASALVAVNSLLAAADVLSPVQCAGDANGSIEVTAGGGELPFEYSLDGVNFQASNIFDNLPAGTYTVTVKDNFGLSITASPVVLTDPAPISVSATSNLNTISASASGGTGSLTYSLDGAIFQTSGNFGSLSNGTYTVTVQDESGCTATATVTVSVEALTANFSVDVQIPCNGGGATISVHASGGVPPYQYRLDNNPLQSSNTFSNVTAGLHTVRIVDAAGTLTIIQDFEIMEPTVVEASASVVANDLTANALGGTPGYTFGLSNGMSNATGVFLNQPNGTYVVTATDANGCTGTAEVTIAYTPLHLLSTQVFPVSCFGSTDGGCGVSVSGGVPPYQYSLDGTNFQSSPNFQNLPAGVYGITVRDAAGDIFVVNGIIVNEPTLLTLSATVNGYTVSATPDGGVGSYEYSLDGGAFQSSPSFQNVAPGQHTITVKDGKGCTATTTVTVVLIPVSATVSNVQGTCQGTSGGAANICYTGGLPPFTLTWTPTGGNLANLPNNCFGLSNLAVGNYTAVVTDAAGQVAPVTFSIGAFPVVNVSVLAVSDDIIVTATGGTAPYQYALNSGQFQNSNVFENQPNGTYTIKVKDANGCVYETSFNLVPTVEPGTEWGIVVSPNPSNGMFEIDVKQAPQGKLFFDVYDLAGRRLDGFVSEKTGAAFRETLDLTGLPAGSYLLRISDGARSGALRLAIVK